MTALFRAKLPEVNACHWCDQPHDGHDTRWASIIGFHTFVHPTDATRKRRLLARRTERGLPITTGRR